VSACVEALLLSIVKYDSNIHKCNTTHALLMSTYSALFFFLSATLSGLILTNWEFSVLTLWKQDPIQCGRGSNCSWIWVMRHCECSVFSIRASPPYSQNCRSGLSDRGYHIRDRADPFLRLAGGVDLDQDHIVNHHGVRRAFLGTPHSAPVTRLTGCPITGHTLFDIIPQDYVGLFIRMKIDMIGPSYLFIHIK
jgi:hypothetical protein